VVVSGSYFYHVSTQNVTYGILNVMSVEKTLILMRTKSFLFSNKLKKKENLWKNV